jgi:pimeloyl-ACP methyl ester carboxylesterase
MPSSYLFPDLCQFCTTPYSNANVRLVVFEDSGHIPSVEERERYIEVVQSFLDRYVA